MFISDNVLLCPRCGDGNGSHVNVVQIAARQHEDGDISTLEVNDHGDVKRDLGYVPAGKIVREGRRHRIALRFECEFCATGPSWLIFTQHKGQTLVEWKNTLTADQTIASILGKTA